LVHHSEDLHPAQREALQESGLYLLERDLVVEEMIDALGRGTKKGTGGRGDDFRIFWERYKPHELDLPLFMRNGIFDGLYFSDCLNGRNLRQSYHFRFTDDAGSLLEASNAAVTCLDRGAAHAYTADFGTFNILVSNSMGVKGYLRLFLTEFINGEPALAMDTMEIGHRSFKSHGDWVRAMTLAANQFALDMGAKWLIGGDGRVKYGSRQAFGNLYQENGKLRKVGEKNFHLWDVAAPQYVPYIYQFDKKTGKFTGKSSVLMRNWRPTVKPSKA
jgi:hypothetical protein